MVTYDAVNGTLEWVARNDAPTRNSDSAWDLTVGIDGSVYATGFSRGVGTGPHYITIAHDGETGAHNREARCNGPTSRTPSPPTTWPARIRDRTQPLCRQEGVRDGSVPHRPMIPHPRATTSSAWV